MSGVRMPEREDKKKKPTKAKYAPIALHTNLVKLMTEASPNTRFTFENLTGLVRQSSYAKKIYLINFTQPYYAGPKSLIFTVNTAYIIVEQTIQYKNIHVLLKKVDISSLEEAKTEVELASRTALYLEMRNPFIIDYDAYIRMTDLRDPQTYEGENLEVFIEKLKQKVLGLSDFIDVLEMAIEFCGQMIEIHKKNIVHCDVKPTNVFFNKKIYVVDFGLSMTADTLSYRIVGTPLHFSPYLFRSKIYNSSHCYMDRDDFVGVANTLAALLLFRTETQYVTAYYKLKRAYIKQKKGLTTTTDNSDIFHKIDATKDLNYFSLASSYHANLSKAFEAVAQNKKSIEEMKNDLVLLLAKMKLLASHVIEYANAVLACIKHPFWMVNNKHVLGEKINPHLQCQPFEDAAQAEQFILKLTKSCVYISQARPVHSDKYSSLERSFLCILGHFKNKKASPSARDIDNFLTLMINHQTRYEIGDDYISSILSQKKLLADYVAATPGLQKSTESTRLMPSPLTMGNKST